MVLQVWISAFIKGTGGVGSAMQLSHHERITANLAEGKMLEKSSSCHTIDQSDLRCADVSQKWIITAHGRLIAFLTALFLTFFASCFTQSSQCAILSTFFMLEPCSSGIGGLCQVYVLHARPTLDHT